MMWLDLRARGLHILRHPMLAITHALLLSYNVIAPSRVGNVAAASTSSVGMQTSRRTLLGAAVGLLSVGTLPRAAHAAQDVNDLTRLKRGLADVQFLLDNWVRETTDPNSGDQTPDRVRYFLGLRTTDHPLFQVEKLLAKAQDKLPDDVDFDVWINAVEGYQSHVNKVNELAYTSSFGEYNPGGGKGQVAKYLELAKEEVVLVRDSLKVMCDLLKV